MWRPGGLLAESNKKEATTESEVLMSSDAVPAALPGPDDAAGAPTTSTPEGDASKGLLDSLLTPISAARPATFNIDPLVNEINQGNAPEVSVDGASSDSYHLNDDNPKDSGKNSSEGRRETSIMRAWLLAGAERWRKAGDARLKTLDIKKARAQALQVKESRTVNRSEKILGGNTSNGTGSLNNTGKSLDNKTNNRPGKHRPTGGSKPQPNGTTKNAPANNKGTDRGSPTSKNRESAPQKPAHRTGPGMRAAARDRAADRIRNGQRDKAGTGSTGSKGAGTSGTGKGNGQRKDRATGPKTPKGSGGTGGVQEAGGKSGKDTPAKGHLSPNGKVNLKKDPGPKNRDGHGKSGDSDAGRVTLGKAVAAETKDRLNNVGDRLNNRLNERRANPDPAVISRHKADKDSKTDAEKAPDGKKVDLKKPGTGESAKKDGKDAAAGTAPKEPAKTPDAKPEKPAAGPDVTETKGTDAKPWTLRDSREAGYRDGARAGKAAGHVKAYRDGAKDGWTDQKEAAAREKNRLDRAHDDRKKQRTEDQPVPGQPSSADYHQSPQPAPIGVTGADASGIHLGGDTIRPSMSRGEVRTFVGFQQNFAGRTAVMVRVAERSKAYEAHAANQTKKISSLLEQAKAVKGGEKLVEKLTRLEEASKLQEAAARKVHQRAVRGADGCKALAANADTRYGEIVRVAADSADGPAELKYYQDRGLANA